MPPVHRKLEGMPAAKPIPFDEPLSDEEIDLFGAFRALLPILVEGRLLHAPEGNNVLRVLQYLELNGAAVRMDWGRYCWNNTEGCCEMRYRLAPEDPVRSGRACQIQVCLGLEIVKLPKGGRLCPPKDE